MKIALFLRNSNLENDRRFTGLLQSLDVSGCGYYILGENGILEEGTDFLMVVGGDGTFLSAATVVRDSCVPIVGVNLGRLGFLSENRPENVVEALVAGDFEMEHRSLLHLDASVSIPGWPYALNEISVHRKGPAMLGVDVSVDGSQLPTYWADGLLIATSSGSTAYSLSVGGPIVMPESKVLIISPISPHNLNVRPLIVPDSVSIRLSFRAREDSVNLTLDNRSVEIPADSGITVSLAQFSLERVRLAGSDFINALTSKLYWGEDIRNTEH